MWDPFTQNLGWGWVLFFYLFDKRYRIILLWDINLKKGYTMLFIVPVIVLNLLGLVMAVAGHPLFGFGLVVVAFLYIAKCFID